MFLLQLLHALVLRALLVLHVLVLRVFLEHLLLATALLRPLLLLHVLALRTLLAHLAGAAPTPLRSVAEVATTLPEPWTAVATPATCHGLRSH